SLVGPFGTNWELYPVVFGLCGLCVNQSRSVRSDPVSIACQLCWSVSCNLCELTVVDTLAP
ncbi:hypothetical protein A2U01_0081108, partial [Trifolium medium]|nr:hypothetical protein [Trifolium medium]